MKFSTSIAFAAVEQSHFQNQNHNNLSTRANAAKPNPNHALKFHEKGKKQKLTVMRVTEIDITVT